MSILTITLLIRLYKMYTRPYMDYACTAMTTLSKSQRHKLEVTQNCCLHYARTAIDSTCTSNSELWSHCNIISVEQRILALANSWWEKASKNKNAFEYHQRKQVLLIQLHFHDVIICMYFTIYFSGTTSSTTSQIQPLLAAPRSHLDRICW